MSYCLTESWIKIVGTMYLVLQIIWVDISWHNVRRTLISKVICYGADKLKEVETSGTEFILLCKSIRAAGHF